MIPYFAAILVEYTDADAVVIYVAVKSLEVGIAQDRELCPSDRAGLTAFPAGHYLSENIGSNVLFANFDSWTRAVHIEVSLR